MDLYWNRPVERLHELAGVCHNDHFFGRRDQDLFTQQGASSSFYHVELGVYLVSAVKDDVNVRNPAFVSQPERALFSLQLYLERRGNEFYRSLVWQFRHFPHNVRHRASAAEPYHLYALDALYRVLGKLLHCVSR